MKNSDLSFDIYIVNPIQPATSESGDIESSYLNFRNRGWLFLRKDLDATRQILKKILEKKGNAYIVPQEYSTPTISQDEAYVTALEEHHRLVEHGKNLAPFTLIIDDILWWTFIADDLNAIEKDVFPGQVFVSIDKLDGHIRTQEEFLEWLKLSAP